MKATPEQTAAAVELMRDAGRWPLPDILPLVRGRGGDMFPELGLLLAFRGRASSVVYLTSAFEPALYKRLEVCEREIFLTFEELVESGGWQVD